MSKILVDTIDTRSGTTNLTIGSTNSSTVTFENGAVTGHMYPAFFVYRYTAGDQSLTAGTVTKVQFDDEFYDTDNAYDDTTNYRFTVPSGKAGKYFIYSALRVDGTSMNNGQIRIYKNGAGVVRDQNLFTSNSVSSFSLKTYAAIDLAVNDYVEIYVLINNGSSITVDAKLDPMTVSYFGGYRIGS